MKKTILSSLLMALLLQAPTTEGQMIGESLMSDLDVYTGAECEPEIAVVQMNIPIRYISHFPRMKGKSVRVRIRPLAVSALDEDGLDERESRAPAFRRKTLLREATFEGDIQGGPFITLRFSQASLFRVFQGPDFRSLWLVISPASFAPDSPCEPTALNGNYK